MKKITKKELIKKMEELGIDGCLINYAQTMMSLDEVEKLVASREKFLTKKIVDEKIPTRKERLDSEDFKLFPKEVQNEVISVLGAYDECNVSYENGRWEVSPDCWIASKYAKDHKFYGTFYYDDLVKKVKGLEEAREKYLDDFSKMNVSDSFWA